MNLVEVNLKVRCDMPNCKEMAKFKLVKTGFVKNAGLLLCKNCVKDVYETIGACIVPKSPNNMLNKKIINKKEKGEIHEKI